MFRIVEYSLHCGREIGCIMINLLFQVSGAGYDRQAVADHANNLASKIRGNLTNSLKALGVDILTGFGTILVSDMCSVV